MKIAAFSPVRIRVLGAPGTGKSQLAAELSAALSAGDPPGLAFTIDDDPPQTLSTTEAQAGGPVLLMGLDLPASGPNAGREAADQALRAALAQAGIAYQVVYGHGAERLQNALLALQSGRPHHVAPDRPARRIGNWVWTCDNCSDPQCERRLLSDLLAARTNSP